MCPEDGSAVSWGSLNTDTTWVQEELYEVVQLSLLAILFPRSFSYANMIEHAQRVPNRLLWSLFFAENEAGHRFPARALRSLQATSTAFTAVRRNGSIVTWGDLSRGGQRQSQLHGVRQVQAFTRCFWPSCRDRIYSLAFINSRPCPPIQNPRISTKSTADLSFGTCRLL